MSDLMSVGDDTFKAEVLESQMPVLVDFHATWCGPCKAIAPIIEQLAVKFAGQMKFVKADIDQAPDVTAEYGIMGVPTLVIFKNGEIVKRMVGAGSSSAIEKVIRSGLEE